MECGKFFTLVYVAVQVSTFAVAAPAGNEWRHCSEYLTEYIIGERIDSTVSSAGIEEVSKLFAVLLDNTSAYYLDRFDVRVMELDDFFELLDRTAARLQELIKNNAIQDPNIRAQAQLLADPQWGPALLVERLERFKSVLTKYPVTAELLVKSPEDLERDKGPKLKSEQDGLVRHIEVGQLARIQCLSGDCIEGRIREKSTDTIEIGNRIVPFSNINASDSAILVLRPDKKRFSDIRSTLSLYLSLAFPSGKSNYTDTHRLSEYVWAQGEVERMLDVGVMVELQDYEAAREMIAGVLKRIKDGNGLYFDFPFTEAMLKSFHVQSNGQWVSIASIFKSRNDSDYLADPSFIEKLGSLFQLSSDRLQ